MEGQVVNGRLAGWTACRGRLAGERRTCDQRDRSPGRGRSQVDIGQNHLKEVVQSQILRRWCQRQSGRGGRERQGGQELLDRRNPEASCAPLASGQATPVEDYRLTKAIAVTACRGTESGEVKSLFRVHGFRQGRLRRTVPVSAVAATPACGTKAGGRRWRNSSDRGQDLMLEEVT